MPSGPGERYDFFLSRRGFGARGGVEEPQVRAVWWRAERPKVMPQRKAPLMAGLELRGRGLAYPASLVAISAGWIMRSNRQPLVQLCGKLLRERKVCTSDILAFASSHDQPRSGPNNSERESTSGRSTNYGSGRLIQVFRDIGRIFSLLFLLNHPSPIGHPTRGRVQKRKRNMVSSKAKNGFNRVSCGTHRVDEPDGVSFAKTRTPPSVWEGRGLGNPPEGYILRSTAFNEGLRLGNKSARQKFLTERPARKAHRTRSWKPAALLLTGHQAQAPTVLDHSRTLP